MRKSLTRTQVREVPCPACFSEAGQLCRNTRGARRTTNHRERVNRANANVKREQLRPGPHTAVTQAQFALIGRLVVAREGITMATEADALIRRLQPPKEEPPTGRSSETSDA